MKLYDVDGYDTPLRLSEEHAELIGAKEHDLPAAAPSRSAAKAAWADYAVGQGADPAYAESATRAELIEQYGA
jgi:hypothetical protein